MQPGATDTVHGNGFAPDSNVAIVLESEPVLLGVTQADSSGVVDAQYTIPADTPEGNHTLKLEGTNPDGSARVLSFAMCVGDCSAAAGGGEVTGGGSSSTAQTIATSTSSGALAFTGGSTGLTVGIAAAVLVIGIALFAASRKKKESELEKVS